MVSVPFFSRSGQAMRLNNSASSGVPSLRTLSYWGSRLDAMSSSVRGSSTFGPISFCRYLSAPCGSKIQFWLRWKYYARNAADSPVDKFEDALESSVNRFHDHTALDVFREIRGCVPYPDGADDRLPSGERVGDTVAFVVCHDGSFFDCFLCGQLLWIVDNRSAWRRERFSG